MAIFRKKSTEELIQGGPQEIERYVIALLEDAGFQVLINDRRIRGGADILAFRRQFGRTKEYAIECKTFIVGASEAEEILARWTPIKELGTVDEFWLVAGNASGRVRKVFESKGPRYRFFTIDELQDAFGTPTIPRPQAPAARTVAGKAILANHREIGITSAALLVLIDERLASLHGERPNSREATAQRDEAIARYELLKGDVENLAQMAADFKKGTANERAPVKASKSLADGIRNWWTKEHEKIVQSAYDMSMFGTAVAICSMAGSGGKVAVAVSAALVGGKKLGDVLKGLKGLWN